MSISMKKGAMIAAVSVLLAGSVGTALAGHHMKGAKKNFTCSHVSVKGGAVKHCYGVTHRGHFVTKTKHLDKSKLMKDNKKVDVKKN